MLFNVTYKLPLVYDTNSLTKYKLPVVQVAINGLELQEFVIADAGHVEITLLNVPVSFTMFPYEYIAKGL